MISAKPSTKPIKSKTGKSSLPNLPQINPNAAGIDIGSTSHWVSVPQDREAEWIRSCGCFTANLSALADWLQQCGIETVAMESTGVYWIPGFQILEPVMNFSD